MLAKLEFSEHFRNLMKIKIVVVILALAAVVLAIGLIKTSQDAAKEHQDLTQRNNYLSNSLSQTTADLESQKQMGLQLQKDVADRNTHIVELSNDLSQANDTLAQKDAALKAASDEATAYASKIAELTSTNEALDKQAMDLRGSITSLETQIADTQKKLDASEGDKAFLQKELERLTAEKQELERKFNDLAVLRDQVRKLKEELDVSRRLEWIRQGIFNDQKGGQKIMQGALAANTGKPANTNAYDLNVEVKSDGSVQVIPPISNSPASNSSTVDPNSPIK
jgi:predicted  nucleic acid-binding Zn-ribbon protein